MIYLRRNNILVAVILKTKENCVRCRAFVIGLDLSGGYISATRRRIFTIRNVYVRVGCVLCV